MLEEILELHKEGRFEEAEARYRELLVFNPDDPETLHLLGIVRRQRGDIVEAITLVRRATELNPERANYLLTLAGMELHARLWDQARSDFQAALALDPNLTSAYSALAQIAMLRREPAEAEENFKLALRAGDERVEVLTGYGNLLLQRGLNELALKYLTRAVELWPQVASAQGSLGRAYLAVGRDAFAEQALKNALELHAEFYPARLMLAEAQLKQGRFDDARTSVLPLNNVPTQRGAALAILGDISRAQGDLGQATTFYRDALLAKREQPRVMEALGWCLSRLNLRREAIGAYRGYLEHQPDDGEAHRAVAQLLAQEGAFAAAAEGFRTALKHGVEEVPTRLALAAMLELDGQYPQAEQEIDAVLARDPNAPGAVQIKARAQLARDDAAAALATLSGADSAKLPAPARRLGAALRGRAHAGVGQVVEAVAAWLEAQSARAGAPLPPLVPVDPSLAEIVTEAAQRGANSGIAAPAALLLGAPGSGVEWVAALLADAPALTVLADRYSPQPRTDLFTSPEFGRYLAGMSDDDARIVARHYERPLKRLKPPGDRRWIDWLPHWDARFVPAVHRIFGRLPLIVAYRDPRDALLQWLAFGAVQGLSCADPEAAAAWLKLESEHLRWTREHAGLPVLWIDTARLSVDAQGVADQLAQVLGIEPFAPGANFARARTGLGGLSNTVPAGRWQDFDTALRPAFARLEPVAG